MTKHAQALIILISFVTMFLISRFVVAGLFGGWLKIGGFLFIKGQHIHHLNYGILALIFSGFASHCLTFKRWFTALTFGIGLGLVTDEYGMILLLDDDYYNKISYIAVALILSLLGACTIETKRLGL